MSREGLGGWQVAASHAADLAGALSSPLLSCTSACTLPRLRLAWQPSGMLARVSRPVAAVGEGKLWRQIGGPSRVRAQGLDRVHASASPAPWAC